MGCVQGDGDGDVGGSHSPAVHSGQAEAVEQTKALHFTVAARVAILYFTCMDPGKQGHANPQKKTHPRLGGDIKMINK